MTDKNCEYPYNNCRCYKQMGNDFWFLPSWACVFNIKTNKMVFGKSYAERAKEMREPKKIFAWFPTHLTDGRWAWLTTVERFYVTDLQANWAGDDSHHEYRTLS